MSPVVCIQTPNHRSLLYCNTTWKSLTLSTLSKTSQSGSIQMAWKCLKLNQYQYKSLFSALDLQLLDGKTMRGWCLIMVMRSSGASIIFGSRESVNPWKAYLIITHICICQCHCYCPWEKTRLWTLH